MSTRRLGVTVIPGAGWRAGDVRDVAREAEAAGFDAIFTTEVNNDALATAQLMGSATTHIQIGTWIANIYLRHSYTCAKGASLIADDTGGRFILGLGVSHQPPAALSDHLLDSFCLFGPASVCQERLAAYRAAGVALPILNPPIGPDAALAVIHAFAR